MGREKWRPHNNTKKENHLLIKLLQSFVDNASESYRRLSLTNSRGFYYATGSFSEDGDN